MRMTVNPIALWAAAFAFLVQPALAADIFQDDGFDVRWDNTLRYSAAFRLSPPQYALTLNPNGDDGDRNFAAGLVSNRIDLLSEFDASRGDYGVHVSGAAWY